MKTSAYFLIVAVLMASAAIQAQQSPSPEPQQAQASPCPTTTTATGSAPSGNPVVIDPNSKAAQKIGGVLGKLGQYSPIDIQSTARNIQQRAKNKTGPCDPQTLQAVSAVKAQPAAPRLPSDTVVTLKCNPMAPSTNGGHQTALVLADPQNFAVPKASDFLADSVSADLSAHTPCFLIRTDPATKKVFVLSQ